MFCLSNLFSLFVLSSCFSVPSFYSLISGYYIYTFYFIFSRPLLGAPLFLITLFSPFYYPFCSPAFMCPSFFFISLIFLCALASEFFLFSLVHFITEMFIALFFIVFDLIILQKVHEINTLLSTVYQNNLYLSL